MRPLLVGVCALLVVSPVFAQKIPLKSYGQEFVDEALIRNPDVLVMAIHHAAASAIGRHRRLEHRTLRQKGRRRRHARRQHRQAEPRVGARRHALRSRIGAQGCLRRYDRRDRYRLSVPCRRRSARAAEASRSDPRCVRAAHHERRQPLGSLSVRSGGDDQNARAENRRRDHGQAPRSADHGPARAAAGRAANIILASSIGRIGKTADEDD